MSVSIQPGILERKNQSCFIEMKTFSGPSSIALLTQDVMDYLLANLDTSCDPSVILYSLIALEKFAQTSENKITINRRLNEDCKCNALEKLEQWYHHYNYVQREVGFCAQWCLDNLCKYL